MPDSVMHADMPLAARPKHLRQFIDEGDNRPILDILAIRVRMPNNSLAIGVFDRDTPNNADRIKSMYPLPCATIKRGILSNLEEVSFVLFSDSAIPGTASSSELVTSQLLRSHCYDETFGAGR